MSKEMAVIALGVLVILTRTFLGIPGSWQTVLLVVSGVGLVILGFLLRGEAIGRQARVAPRASQRVSYPYADNLTEEPATAPEPHEERGITSLN